jgi:hypothetical protein
MTVIMVVHLVRMKYAQNVTILMDMNFLEQSAVVRRLICSLMEMMTANHASSFILTVPLASLYLSPCVRSVSQGILWMLMVNVPSLENVLLDVPHAKGIHVLLVILDLPSMVLSAATLITTILILMAYVYPAQLFKLDAPPAPTNNKLPQLHVLNVMQGKCITSLAPNAAIVAVINSSTQVEAVRVALSSKQIA